MEFTKFENRKIYEKIATHIESQILSGVLKPGDKLPSTKELSESFQVGRSTIREALSALKAKGLLEIHQGEGSYVRLVEPDDVKLPNLESLLLGRQAVLELLEARKALETANAGIAALKRNDADLEAFRRVLEAMEAGLGDEEAGERADVEFHRVLAAATHNSIMVRLLETISGQMELAIRETRRLQMYASLEESRQLWKEHAAIYEAVRDGDAAAAQQAMQDHLLHVEKVLTAYLA
ncbi:FadR/GntR family transcriptional regulator [Paenibacillus chartarius]|uniref:FadR/GntR family transcriptional regulator n=1 Tax=Paenibacillus chartarius TaxID=747481 RepID=A0ABV6DI78_9BACL